VSLGAGHPDAPMFSDVQMGGSTRGGSTVRSAGIDLLPSIPPLPLSGLFVLSSHASRQISSRAREREREREKERVSERSFPDCEKFGASPERDDSREGNRRISLSRRGHICAVDISIIKYYFPFFPLLSCEIFRSMGTGHHREDQGIRRVHFTTLNSMVLYREISR